MRLGFLLVVAVLTLGTAYAYRGDSSTINVLQETFIANDGNLAYFNNWTLPVTPFLSCSANNQMPDNLYCLSSFGYTNPNTVTIQTFSLEQNQLTPSIANGIQPTIFTPGTVNNAFNVLWWCRAHHRRNLRWTVESPVIDTDNFTALRSIALNVEVDRKLNNCDPAFVNNVINTGNFWWSGDPDS
jgi:hypothetical protein